MTSKQTTLYSSGTVKRDDPYSDDDAKEETKAIKKVRKLTNEGKFSFKTSTQLKKTLIRSIVEGGLVTR